MLEATIQYYSFLLIVIFNTIVSLMLLDCLNDGLTYIIFGVYEILKTIFLFVWFIFIVKPIKTKADQYEVRYSLWNMN